MPPPTLLPLNCPPPFHFLLQQLQRPPTLNPSPLPLCICSEQYEHAVNFCKKGTTLSLQILFPTWIMPPKCTVCTLQVHYAFVPEQSALLRKLFLLVQCSLPREFLCSIVASSPIQSESEWQRGRATGKREFLILNMQKKLCNVCKISYICVWFT